MNCFQWQNHSSDYLDGNMPTHLKQKADDHLKQCRDCRQHYHHYRLILTSITRQPMKTLPASLKKAPLRLAVPRPQSIRIRLSQWERIPWYLRTLLEGVGIVFIILIAISSAPKLRTLYEKNIERSLNDFKESLDITPPLAEEIDLSVPPSQEKQSADLGSTPSSEDAVSGEDEAEEAAPSEINAPVGKSQLWRFTLKSVSLDEIRPQVVKTLKDLGISPHSTGAAKIAETEGLQVPGGIEFNLILPDNQIPGLKNALEKLVTHPLEQGTLASGASSGSTSGAGPGSGPSTGPSGNDNFSWYRVKSKRGLPEGKSQVVIWLAQPN